MILIFFIYGLAFFTMGLAIFILPKKCSAFKLANKLWLLAGFGIFHGINEWIDMFMLINKPAEIPLVEFTRVFILAVSYLFLVVFGTEIISEEKKKASVLRMLPVFLTIIWIAVIILNKQPSLRNTCTRYLLGIPGSALTAYALFLQIAEFKRMNLVTVIKSLKLEVVAFSFYGLFSGLIVPRSDFFPASFLNYETFFMMAGIPIQVFRAICAVVITYAIIRILSIFEWETNNKIRNLLKKTRDSYVKLEQLEKIKDSLTHMIVHDLNNPLTAISGELQILKMEEREFSAEQKKGLNSAFAASEDLKRMISDLLFINKMEENQLKLNCVEFKLEGLVQEVADQLSVMAQMEHKTISLDTAGDMPEMSADIELVRRTIANLVNNAIKHSPSGGNVLIKAFFKEEDNNFYILVRDSGGGIPEEYLNKIFDKFVQVNNEKAKMGHGLGLTFCKMAVEAHGGKIWVESELDKGSTFYFTVPANK